MTRVMREFSRPEISFEAQPWGLQITALRPMTEQLTHVRVTNAILPATFVIPLSETMTITQMHVPVDDTHTYWYSFFTSFAGPLDHEAMRAQRLQFIRLPDYCRTPGRHNDWGFKPGEQRTRTYLGMGEEDINVHDQWAVESMGAIQDRTREHLGTIGQGHHGQPAPAAAGHRHRAGRRHASGPGRRGAGAADAWPRHRGRHRPCGRMGHLVAHPGAGQARPRAMDRRQRRQSSPRARAMSAAPGRPQASSHRSPQGEGTP